MLILSIETSGNLCGIALSNGNQVVAEYSINENNQHDRMCAELIRRALDDNKLKVNDLNAVAVSAGPGSFTGLRIGASIAKSLCFSMNIKDNNPKLIAVPTLSALAYNFKKTARFFRQTKLLVAIQAQKDTFYYQNFDFELNSESEIILANKDSIDDDLFKNSICIGPFFKNNNSYLQDYCEYSAKAIARYAQELYQSEKFSNPESFTPLYIQEFQVKTKKKKLII